MAVKVVREQPLLFLPHKEIMKDFSQFCQVVILYTVFLKSMDKVIYNDEWAKGGKDEQ